MKYTDNEMCTILLSSYIGLSETSEVKPLSLGEWNKFVDVLVENKLEPSIAYKDEVINLKNVGYDDDFIERIKSLTGRGAKVAFELEEYEKKGINVITFLDKNYPKLLRRELKNKRPPVLFYAGDISLSNKVGIGIVGARNVTGDGVQFTTDIVKKAVDENIVIYSGGAKGVDVTAQTVALNEGGAVVAYIADSLTTKIKKKDITQYVAEGRLLLVSDLKPDVGFSVGRAMNRNKFIYASAMGTFVVESDYNKGGTWTGAMEAIKNNWGKVFVFDNSFEGNRKLIEAGGNAYKITDGKLIDIIMKPKDELGMQKNVDTSANKENYRQMTLMDFLKSN